MFSFVSNLFSGVSQLKSSLNSQTVALLEAPLNINPFPATGGADITIVENSALLSDNDPVGGLSENLKNAPSSDQISIYIVRQGDTLGGIAKMFGVSVNTIRWNNDISGSTITPGQTLTILPISGVRHTVKKGDTVGSIAKLYKGDVGDIERYNNITADTKLSIGDIVIVPDGEMRSSGGSQVQFVTNSKVFEGYYMRPVPGPKTQGIHGHNAVDLAPPYGTSVVAAAEGTIIVSRIGGWNGGYGIYVVIQHPNGTQTLYSHMSKNYAVIGQHVNQGEVIGNVGATGEATGPHLHFEIRGARNPF
jgi:LysM repeat protein